MDIQSWQYNFNTNYNIQFYGNDELLKNSLFDEIKAPKYEANEIIQNPEILQDTLFDNESSIIKIIGLEKEIKTINSLFCTKTLIINSDKKVIMTNTQYIICNNMYQNQKILFAKHFSSLLKLPINSQLYSEISNLYDLRYYAICEKLLGKNSTLHTYEIKWFKMEYTPNCIFQNIENSQEIWAWMAFLYNQYNKQNQSLHASIIKHFNIWCIHHLPNEEALFFLAQNVYNILQKNI